MKLEKIITNYKKILNATINILKHFYLAILIFILNIKICLAGDNSDKILFFMIGIMVVSAVGIVAFIVLGNKNK